MNNIINKIDAAIESVWEDGGERPFNLKRYLHTINDSIVPLVCDFSAGGLEGIPHGTHDFQ